MSVMIYGPVKPAAASGELGHKSLSLYARQGVAGCQPPPATPCTHRVSLLRQTELMAANFYALVLLWVYFKYQEICYML